MTRVAGEVADGLFVHPLNSPEFIRSTTWPALQEGFARAGRTRDGFEVNCQALVITGYTEEEVQRAELHTRMQLAFYGSTPQYRCVLEAHGWGELQTELNALSKQGRWMEMSQLLDERMLDTFTVRCEPPAVAARLRARFGAVVDRLSVLCHATPHIAHPEQWAEVVAALQAPSPGVGDPHVVTG